MKSMTGFGASSGSHLGGLKQVAIEVTIRSVNGRYLEPRFHLPREYLSFESGLKKSLQTEFQRGTIDIFVARKVTNKNSHQIRVHDDLAVQYHRELLKLSRKLKISEPLSLSMILGLPDVIQVDSQVNVSPEEEKILFRTFEKAVKACMKERNREGEALRRELQNYLKDLQLQVGSISNRRMEVNVTLQERYLAKLQQKMEGLNLAVDGQRLLQEIVVQVDKSDIAEELSRLEEHMNNCQNILVKSSQEAPSGKKLDFYTQELLREMNTIGSKSQVSDMTHSVVECKTIIERLREQIQNVE
jgi:uncharacterized protein (TIGR00255 family)